MSGTTPCAPFAPLARTVFFGFLLLGLYSSVPVPGLYLLTYTSMGYCRVAALE